MLLNRSLLLAKTKAIGLHLAVSSVLVGIALALMWFVWFPPPLFFTDGGGMGLKLLLLVDLVLGPVLTFVVFNPAKSWRELRVDLGLIALVQLSAYGYGLWSIHSVRVEAVAWHEGVFHPVAANLFETQEVEPGSWQKLGDGAPYLVNSREPVGEEGVGVATYNMMEGLAQYQLQYLYEPLSKAWPKMRAAGVDLAALRIADPDSAKRAESWLGSRDATGVRFYRVEGFYDNAIMVLDDEGQWLGGFRGDLKASFSASPRS